MFQCFEIRKTITKLRVLKIDLKKGRDYQIKIILFIIKSLS